MKAACVGLAHPMRLTSVRRYQCDRRHQNKKNAVHNRPGRISCRCARLARLLVGVLAAVAVLGMAVSAEAQEKKIKIGVIFDLTGPLAGGGSELQYTGVKIMLDHYAKTGVEGYKIEAVYADAQSKPDVAINEAVRLLEQEKVDMLMGFFSSAQCVPVAARVEQMKKFMWITTCISSGVFDDKNYKYVFRPQASRRSVRHDDDGFHRAEREVEVRQGAEGSARRHHPRGWRLWRRRVEGQRGRRQEGRLQRGAEGRLFGDRARSLRAGHQAEAGPARRDLPHRLQSRHHAAVPAGARTGAEVRRHRRPWRGLRRLREAEGRSRRRRQLSLQHRSDLDLAREPEGHGSRSCRRSSRWWARSSTS